MRFARVDHGGVLVVGFRQHGRQSRRVRQGPQIGFFAFGRDALEAVARVVVIEHLRQQQRRQQQDHAAGQQMIAGFDILLRQVGGDQLREGGGQQEHQRGVRFWVPLQQRDDAVADVVEHHEGGQRQKDEVRGDVRAAAAAHDVDKAVVLRGGNGGAQIDDQQRQPQQGQNDGLDQGVPPDVHQLFEHGAVFVGVLVFVAVEFQEGAVYALESGGKPAEEPGDGDLFLPGGKGLVRAAAGLRFGLVPEMEVVDALLARFGKLLLDLLLGLCGCFVLLFLLVEKSLQDQLVRVLACLFGVAFGDLHQKGAPVGPDGLGGGVVRDVRPAAGMLRQRDGLRLFLRPSGGKQGLLRRLGVLKHRAGNSLRAVILSRRVGGRRVELSRIPGVLPFVRRGRRQPVGEFLQRRFGLRELLPGGGGNHLLIVYLPDKASLFLFGRRGEGLRSRRSGSVRVGGSRAGLIFDEDDRTGIFRIGIARAGMIRGEADRADIVQVGNGRAGVIRAGNARIGNARPLRGSDGAVRAGPVGGRVLLRFFGTEII